MDCCQEQCGRQVPRGSGHLDTKDGSNSPVLGPKHTMALGQKDLGPEPARSPRFCLAKVGLHLHPVCKKSRGVVQGPRWNGRTQLLRGVSPQQGHLRKGTLPLLTPFRAGVPEQSGAASPEAGPRGTLGQQGRGVPTWPPFSPGGPSLPGCPCQEREGLR